MLEIIKKIGLFLLRRFLNLFELLLLVAMILLFGLQTTWFQNFLGQQLANYYSHELNTEVKIEQIKLNGWEYAEISGLYIADQRGDTLIYSPHLSGSLQDLSLDSRFAILKAVNSEHTRIKIQKYKGEEVFNLQFLIDYFKTDEEKEDEVFTIKIKEVALNNAHISFNNWNKEVIEYGIDYEHIELSNVTGKILGLRTRGDVTTLDLEGVSLKDRSGFQLDHLSCHLLVNPKKIKMEQLKIHTPHSNIQTKGISLRYHDYGDLQDFMNAVSMYASIQPTSISTLDLSYFIPSLRDVDHKIKLECEVEGPFNDILVSDMYLGLSPVTFFNGDISVRGLPDVENALIGLDIDVLQTSKEDIDSFDFTDFGLEEDLVLPEQLDNLGVIYAMGQLDGYYNDIDLSMDIITDIGVTTGNFRVYDSLSMINYTGHLYTAGLDLELLTGSKELGNFTSDLDVKGRGVTMDDLHVRLDGNLNNFELLDYTYDQVGVHGVFEERAFDGGITIVDPNIDLAFNGEVDLNHSPFQFHFNADVQKAHFYDLNLISDIQRESSSACFTVMAEGSGSTLDEFTGLVYLNEVAYFENGKDYEFESIFFESKGNTNYHTIDVFSQFADISMVGEYSLDTLDQSLYALGAKILPSIFPNSEDIQFNHEDFDLSFKVNNLSKLTELFMPELRVSENTSMHVTYDSDKDLFELASQCEWLEYNDMRFAGIELDTTRKFSAFDVFYTFDLMVDSVYVTPDLVVQNVNLIAKAYEDNVGTSLYWSASDSSYWAKIYGDGYVLSPSEFSFDIKPSQVYSQAGLWHVDHDAHIKIDSTTIKLDNMLATNDYQSIRFDGMVSEDPEAKLNFEIARFDLDVINALMGTESLELQGEINLDGYVSNLYGDFFFDAYTFVEGLSVNSYYAGNIEANSNWDPKYKRMEFAGDLIRMDMNSDFSITKGHYYVNKKEDNLDFQFDFKETDLHIVNAFMPEGMEVQGNTKGTVYLKGSTEKPLLNGSLYLNDVSYYMEMLNTNYVANGQVLIEPDMILMNGIPIKDKFGSEAILVGSFFHQNFEQYSYDFFAAFDDPFLVMNTTYEMNPLYYGDAFATGDISINYEEILEIDVNAKSEKGTSITLPLYGSEDVVLQDFISFVDHTTEEEEYEVDLEGINLTLSMDVTEDAEFQLVFDEVVGDVMKGSGTGHIDMYIDQFYDFYMFGGYEISDGSYLFTLKDFINKKFEVKPGSTISWYGDPYDAEIDIRAYYPLKASLYDIMPINDKEQYRQKTEVECIMHLTQNLFNPLIHFDILLPRTDENARTVLRNLVSTDQEMNKQVFSLLILNKFLPHAEVAGAETSNLGFVEATTSEVLSNQLSNMISNFSDDFDIGFNYSPGDNISNDEVAVAMSTQFFNDRLTVNTNLGVSQGNEANHNPNSFIGDVDIEYKLNPPEGNLRVHAFNESNEYDITKIDQAKHTQGVGAFYQESFNDFGELMCRFTNLFRSGQGNCECDTKSSRKDCKETKRNRKKD